MRPFVHGALFIFLEEFMENVYDILSERGYLDQCTYEDELREMLGKAWSLYSRTLRRPLCKKKFKDQPKGERLNRRP